MSIQKLVQPPPVGFEKLKMVSDNVCAKLFATNIKSQTVQVGSTEDGVACGDYNNYDVQACDEAIAFFTMLRDELKRREASVVKAPTNTHPFAPKPVTARADKNWAW